MGEAFDHARRLRGRFGSLITAREMITRRLIGAARDGQRDPIRLCEKALIPFGIEDMSMLVVSVGRDPPSQPMLRSRTQRDHERAPALCNLFPQRTEAGRSC